MSKQIVLWITSLVIISKVFSSSNVSCPGSCKQLEQFSKTVELGIASFGFISKVFRTSVVSCPGSVKQLEQLSRIYEMVVYLLK